MKRFINILFVFVGGLLVSCATDGDANGVDTPDTPSDAKQQVSFGAYFTRNSRAADASDVNSLNALAQAGGFGVFGYAQGGLDYKTYSSVKTTPEFFYNQQVWNETQASLPDHKGDGDASENWVYSPIRFYDANAGYKHSFFAYAPYMKDAVPVFEYGKAPQLRYFVDQDVDLLWARPTIDKEKPGVSEKVTFNFLHALSKVSFLLAPFVDTVHDDDAHNKPGDLGSTVTISRKLPEGTTIKIRSLKLLGVIPQEALLNMGTGEWTIINSYMTLPVNDAAGIYWDENTSNIETQPTHPLDPSDKDFEYQEVPTETKVIPTQRVKIEVVYDVISEGKTHTNDTNKVHTTNTAVSVEEFELSSGKAYKLYLDLGLTTVKFCVAVGDWTSGKEIEVEFDVPTDVTIEPWEYKGSQEEEFTKW